MMEFSCPECGKVRDFRPATIKRLTTLVCRECIDKASAEKWVTLTCQHCGKERRLPPAEAERRGKTGSCKGCPQHAPAVLPDTFDAGYVLGAVLGDGCIVTSKQKTGMAYCIRLSVTSKKFAERFRGHLAACTGRMPWMKSYTNNRKGNPKIGMPDTRITEWVVTQTNRDWYDRLASYEIGRRFADLPKRSEEFRRGVIQGMLDSEGYLPDDRKYLDIAGSDIGLLRAIAKLFRSLGEVAKIYGPYPYSRGVMHLRGKAGNWIKTKG